jgi:hypothetical protein
MHPIEIAFLISLAATAVCGSLPLTPPRRRAAMLAGVAVCALLAGVQIYLTGAQKTLIPGYVAVPLLAIAAWLPQPEGRSNRRVIYVVLLVLFLLLTRQAEQKRRPEGVPVRVVPAGESR